MKLVLRKLLQYYLKYLTKLALFINRPTIIAIAGSTNKTFVKEEIIMVLREKGIEARANPKSFNTEIGLPLAILNLPSGYHSYREWLPIIFKALFSAIGGKNFPPVLVLELGVANPGDMRYLLSLIKPKIAVITNITQRYLDAFGDMDELAGEYEYLVQRVGKKGLVVLNNDNPRVGKIAEIARGAVTTFGLANGALWQATKVEKISAGQLVEIRHKNKISRHKVKRFGEHHIYTLLIGLIVGDYVDKEKKI